MVGCGSVVLGIVLVGITKRINAQLAKTTNHEPLSFFLPLLDPLGLVLGDLFVHLALVDLG